MKRTCSSCWCVSLIQREAAWKKLGYLKQKGKWTTPAKIAAEHAEAEAQKKADVHWRPLIQQWKAGLAKKEKRVESETALAAVTDPRAVPSIWKAFATGTPADQEIAVDILGHIDGERPSRWPAWRSSARRTSSGGLRRKAWPGAITWMC